jgi:hypothetical protein
VVCRLQITRESRQLASFVSLNNCITDEGSNGNVVESSNLSKALQTNKQTNKQKEKEEEKEETIQHRIIEKKIFQREL